MAERPVNDANREPRLDVGMVAIVLIVAAVLLVVGMEFFAR